MLPARAVVLNAIDASADASSNPINSDHMVNFSVQAIVTGTSTGTLKVQASNDAPGKADSNGVPTITNWTDITSQTVSIAGAGTALIPKFDVSYAWLRLVYTKNNGASGTLTAQFKSNGF